MTHSVRLSWLLANLHRWMYLSDFFLWILWYGVPLVPGLVARQYLDGLTRGTRLEQLGASLVLILGVTIIGRFLVSLAGMLVHWRLMFLLRATLNRNLLGVIFTLPVARALPVPSGDALNRMRDDGEMVVDFLDSLLDLTGNVLFGIVAIVILMRIDATITLFVFMPLLAIALLVQRLGGRIQRFRALSRVATGDVVATLGEVFEAVQAIQVAGTEERVLAHVSRLSRVRQHYAVRDQVLSQLLDSLFGNALLVGTGGILLLGASRLRSGSLTVGDFALFVSYLAYCTNAARWVGRAFTIFKQSTVSWERLLHLIGGQPEAMLVAPVELLSHREDSVPPPPQRQNVDVLHMLAVRHLTFTWPGSGHGIHDVSFSVPRGSFTVITGRIGAGKSTLLRAIQGLVTPDSGDVLWNGRRVHDLAEHFLPPRSAYTPQVPRLFSDTLRNNILMGLPVPDEEVLAAVSRAVLERDYERFPHGLDTEVGRGGVRLSGGQVQRTAAARMFVRKPELLIIDDLSSALDVETERILWERLFAEQETTCLVVSHRKPALQRADQIILLRDGQVEVCGPLRELLETSEEMRLIWGKE